MPTAFDELLAALDIDGPGARTYGHAQSANLKRRLTAALVEQESRPTSIEPFQREVLTALEELQRAGWRVTAGYKAFESNLKHPLVPHADVCVNYMPSGDGYGLFDGATETGVGIHLTAAEPCPEKWRAGGELVVPIADATSAYIVTCCQSAMNVCATISGVPLPFPAAAAQPFAVHM